MTKRTIKIAKPSRPLPCPNCGRAVTSKVANHPYPGLPGVTVEGVLVRRCASCGEQSIQLPDVEKLDREIALGLVGKAGRLTGREIRFLRSVLERSSREFAALLGMNPATVSRWENDAQPISLQTDMLLRAVVRLHLHGDEVTSLARAGAKASRSGLTVGKARTKRKAA